MTRKDSEPDHGKKHSHHLNAEAWTAERRNKALEKFNGPKAYEFGQHIKDLPSEQRDKVDIVFRESEGDIRRYKLLESEINVAAAKLAAAQDELRLITELAAERSTSSPANLERFKKANDAVNIAFSDHDRIESRARTLMRMHRQNIERRLALAFLEELCETCRKAEPVLFQKETVGRGADETLAFVFKQIDFPKVDSPIEGLQATMMKDVLFPKDAPPTYTIRPRPADGKPPKVTQETRIDRLAKLEKATRPIKGRSATQLTFKDVVNAVWSESTRPRLLQPDSHLERIRRLSDERKLNRWEQDILKPGEPALPHIFSIIQQLLGQNIFAQTQSPTETAVLTHRAPVGDSYRTSWIGETRPQDTSSPDRPR